MSATSCACRWAFRSMTSKRVPGASLVHRSVEQHPRPADDRIQRCAQLVRQRRQELVLRAVGGLGLLAGGPLPACLDLVAHVRGDDHDTFDLFLDVPQCRVDEVQVDGLDGAPSPVERHRRLSSKIGIPGAVHLIEKPFERLLLKLRQRLEERAIAEIALRLPPQLAHGRIGELDDVVRTAQDGDERRRLHEQE